VLLECDGQVWVETGDHCETHRRRADHNAAAIDPTGTALGATILTVLVTPALSLLVLRRFRGAVQKSMRSVAEHRTIRDRELRPVAVAVPRAVPGHLSTLSPAATAVSRLQQAVGWYLAAGLAYALLTTVPVQ
jgi:hypothetical protein